MTPRKAGNLLMHLPRGAAVWRFIGGASAITDETDAIWSLEYTEVMLAWGKHKKGQKPQPRKYPKGVNEDRRKQQEFERKAEQFRRKFLHAGDVA